VHDKSPQELGLFLRAAYPVAFSADRFHGFFDADSFAEGQNIDLALAEWHAFGAFVFTCCLWLACKDRGGISTALDYFRPGVLELLSGNDRAHGFFLEIALEREKDYMKRSWLASLPTQQHASLVGFPKS